MFCILLAFNYYFKCRYILFRPYIHYTSTVLIILINNSLLELSCSYKKTELTSTLQWIELSYKIVHEYALESRLFTRVKIIRHLPK